MINVSARAHRFHDRSGDPLDGLVNLFDVGIVLAVGFLLAALASLHLTGTINHGGLHRPADVIQVKPGSVVKSLPPSGKRVVGRGSRVGTVYRLRDGRLIYVVPSAAAPSPSGTP
jgi:hypothetical protein